MTDVEDILRTAFRDHEHLVDGLDPLLPPVRERIARRRIRWILAGAVTAACATAGGGAAVAIGTAGGGTDHRPAPVSGWRWESSRGLEFQVPADWGINDFHCGSPVHATVIRAVGPQLDCELRNPPRVELAMIDAFAAVPRGLPAHTVTFGNVRGQRAEAARGPDGWYRGWFKVESPRATLTVLTRDAATARHILDSARPVTVDHLGCPTRDTDSTLPATPAGPSFVPAGQVSAVACLYAVAEPDNGLLMASAVIPTATVPALAAALDAAPIVHDHSCPAALAGPQDGHAWLRFGDSAGGTTVVEALSRTCAGSVVANGRDWVRLTPETAGLFMTPLHSGFAVEE
jgi:hypothetical protein